MDIGEIERMTLYEYELKKTAYQLKQVDEERMVSFQAWQNYAVQAQKEVGTGKNKKLVPMYPKFQDFFDYEARVNDVLGITNKVEAPKKEKMTKQNKVLQMIKKANS